MKYEHLKGEVIQAEGVTTTNTSSDGRGNISTSSGRHFEVRVKTANGVRDYKVMTKCAPTDELVILWANGSQVGSANLTSGAYHWIGPPSSTPRRLILLGVAIVGGLLTYGLASIGALIYWLVTKSMRSKAVETELKRVANFA